MAPPVGVQRRLTISGSGIEGEIDYKLNYNKIKNKTGRIKMLSIVDQEKS